MIKIFDFLSILIYLVLIILFLNIAKSHHVFAQENSFRIKSHFVFNKKFSGKVRVLDGDSIKVGNKEVRLYGIDAPEFKQKCLNKNNEEYNCGLVSLNFLTKLINGKKVDCYYAQKDKYDRFLSNCYFNNIFINEEIIKNGMAVIYNFTESNQIMDNYEKHAKYNKIGIWQGSFELPKNYRKHNSRN